VVVEVFKPRCRIFQPATHIKQFQYGEEIEKKAR